MRWRNHSGTASWSMALGCVTWVWGNVGGQPGLVMIYHFAGLVSRLDWMPGNVRQVPIPEQ